MTDRRVHAFSPGWEIVRYDRAGKWYAEWVGEGDAPYFADFAKPRRRVALSTREAAEFAVKIDATIVLDLPGGRTFDAHIRRLEDLS